MKKDIIIAPIHYTISDQDTGSEFSWANNYYHKIQKNNASRNLRFKFITGGVSDSLESRENLLNLNIFDPQKINLSIKNIFFFYINLHLHTANLLIKKRQSILHHFLPFHIDRSFNLMALFAKKFVVGPIQSKLLFLDDDLSANDARGFQKENKIKLITNSVIIKILLPIAYFLNSITLHMAKKIIVINDHTKRYLINRGFDEAKIVIIPPGIEIQRFSENFKAKSRPHKRGLRLLTVGYLLNRKQINLAIETVRILTTEYKFTDIRLTIAGDGPQKESLTNLMKKYNLEKYVNFAGFIPNDQINAYYSSADILLNFSKAEGFATVCLEALASGLVIISSPVGGFIDTVKNDENGYILNEDNYPEEAAKIILKLTANPSKLNLISIAARQTAKMYDWDSAIIPKYINLYKNLSANDNGK